LNFSYALVILIAMVSYLSRFFACLLMVLMPLQAIAAVNMTACNCMTKISKVTEQLSTDMPCHKQVKNTINFTQDQQQSNDKNTCESNCAAMCASLTIAAIPKCEINTIGNQASSSLTSISYQSYASITQPNLLRPPIFLS